MEIQAPVSLVGYKSDGKLSLWRLNVFPREPRLELLYVNIARQFAVGDVGAYHGEPWTGNVAHIWVLTERK